MLNWAQLFLTEIKITDVLLVLFTGLLWWSTHKLWLSTHNVSQAALEQVKDMKSSIAESVRAANAMEKVAEAIAISAKAATKSVETSSEFSAQQRTFARLQMRAYLSVGIGGATYQDEKGLFFEARPVLVNDGYTPAHKIRYWARADILPWPLAPEFSFPTSGQATSYSSSLAARHSFILNARVPDYVPAEDVDSIKHSLGIRPKRLCIWGKVSYEDIFGEDHFTNFCHGMYWMGEGEKEGIFGNYSDRHNDSD
jgi:hypothetical protein